MPLGDQATYYIHEGSDGAHRTVDSIAWILGEVDENTADLLVCPYETPTAKLTPAHLFIVRVSKWVEEWDEKQGPRPVGLAYWRPHGEAAPDFAKADKAKADAEAKRQADAKLPPKPKAPPDEWPALPPRPKTTP
jgi:hypothetical protein